MPAKLGTNLEKQLEKANPTEEVEVIFELRVPVGTTAATEPQSRGEKIAVLKEAFVRSVAGLEKAVEKAGGKVTGQAWINQTVRARVPAQAVDELGQLENVAVVDAPRQLTPDES